MLFLVVVLSFISLEKNLNLDKKEKTAELE